MPIKTRKILFWQVTLWSNTAFMRSTWFSLRWWWCISAGQRNTERGPKNSHLIFTNNICRCGGDLLLQPRSLWLVLLAAASSPPNPMWDLLWWSLDPIAPLLLHPGIQRINPLCECAQLLHEFGLHSLHRLSQQCTKLHGRCGDFSKSNQIITRFTATTPKGIHEP